MTTDSLAERVAGIEGIMEHLATRADVERFARRMYVAMTVGLGTATGIILAAMRLWT